MVMLCTLSEAKAQLQMDHSDQDAHITLLIHAASGAVLNYLKRDLTELESDDTLEIDSDGVIVMEDEVKLATLYLIGVMFRDRDGVDTNAWEHGYLPKPVIALLYPLRDPAAA